MSLKNDNRGLSLIEVVVVVGILAILAGSTASAMGYLARGNVKDAAKTFYSAIASNQTFAKAKSGEWMLNCIHDGTQYVLSSGCTTADASGALSTDVYETTYLSNRVTSVQVKDSQSAAYEDFYWLQFHKSSGAVKAINGWLAPKAGYADFRIAIEGKVTNLRLYYLTGEIEMY